jgi:hypothetical protein
MMETPYMSSKRVGNGFSGIGEVFLSEKKIADVTCDLTVLQGYQNVNGVKFPTGLDEIQGTIRAQSGTLPPNVELTLHYLGRWRLKFQTVGNAGAIAPNGGPYEEKSSSPP